AAARVVPPVRAVLLFVPTRTDAEDEAPAGQQLERGRHLRKERRIAVALAEHQMAIPEAREGRREIGQERPTLDSLVCPELDVIRDPDRRELARELLQDVPVVGHP